MKKYKMLYYEDIPCWYELSWDAEHVGIIFRLHQEFIEQVEPIPENSPIVENFREGFKSFDAFNTGLDNDFGFDGKFLYLGEKGDFIEFFVKIPAVKFSINKTCERCNGNKIDPALRDYCYACDGLGLERKFYWNEAYKISATFTILFLFISFPEKETSSPLPQLMTVETITRPGLHGGSLGGVYSVPLVNWLATIPENYGITAMDKAMTQAWDRMCIVGGLDEHRIYTRIANDRGWLNVNIPGNACGLNPAWGAEGDMKEGRGYKFDCHNTDSPMQQLTLLAGLAALHDLARQAIDLEI